MNLKAIKTTTLVIFCALLSLLVNAQGAFDGMKYQAIIRDASGNVVGSQNVRIKFIIYQKSRPITYEEIHTVQTNQLGLVNLEIGVNSQVVTGNFSSIDWSLGNSAAYYILVELDLNDGNGFQDIGESKLMGVPYANYAKEAETAKDDNDRDPNNEIQTFTTSNDTVYLSNGGGFFVFPAPPANNDNDSTNELNTSVTLTNDSLVVTDAGGQKAADLSSLNQSGDVAGLDARVRADSARIDGNTQNITTNTSSIANNSTRISSDSARISVLEGRDTSSTNELNTAVIFRNDSIIVSDAGGNRRADVSGLNQTSDILFLNSKHVADSMRLDTLQQQVNVGAYKDSSSSNETISNLSLSNDSLVITEGGVVTNRLDLSNLNASTPGLDSVLAAGNDGGNQDMTNIKSINVGTNTAEGNKMTVVDSNQNTSNLQYQSALKVRSQGTATSNVFQSGVYSEIQGSNGENIGVDGTSSGNSSGTNTGTGGYARNGDFNRGVHGYADSGRVTIGVQGNADKGKSENYGVSGVATDGDTTNYGVFGQALNGKQQNQGVFGYATGGTLQNMGVHGWVNDTNSSAGNRGVMGEVNGNGAWNEGVSAFSYGNNSTSNTGVYADARNSSGNNTGVFGIARGTTGSFLVYGVYGQADSTGTHKRGVVGVLSGVSNNTDAAVYGIARGTGTNTAVYGRANNTNASDTNIALLGDAANAAVNVSGWFKSGSVYVDDTLFVRYGAQNNYVLTSDANGKAEWKPIPSAPANNDNDSTNELITSFTLVNGALIIAEGGTSDTVSLNGYVDTTAFNMYKNNVQSSFNLIDTRITNDSTKLEDSLAVIRTNLNALNAVAYLDTSATNELLTGASFSNDTLKITDAGGTQNVDLSALNNQGALSDSANSIRAFATTQDSLLNLRIIADSNRLNTVQTTISGLDSRITNDSTRLYDSLAVVRVNLDALNAGAYKDSSSTNEIQALSLSNDTIYLSNGGFVVLPATAVNNDNDSTNELISSAGFANDTLTLTDAGGDTKVDLSALNNLDAINDTATAIRASVVTQDSLLNLKIIADSNRLNPIETAAYLDTSATNEIQALSLSNDTIYLSNGGFVVLPATAVNNDNDSTNELISSAGFSNDTLTLTDAGGDTKVDLSALNNQGAISDTASALRAFATTQDSLLNLRIVADSNRLNPIETAAYLDTSATNEIQALSLSNDTIYLSNGGFVVLPAATANNDNDSTNEILDSIVMINDTTFLFYENGSSRALSLASLGNLVYQNRDSIVTVATDLSNHTSLDFDLDTTNEIQLLSISNDTIYLSNGGFVKLPSQNPTTAYSGLTKVGDSIRLGGLVDTTTFINVVDGEYIAIGHESTYNLGTIDIDLDSSFTDGGSIGITSQNVDIEGAEVGGKGGEVTVTATNDITVDAGNDVFVEGASINLVENGGNQILAIDPDAIDAIVDTFKITGTKFKLTTDSIDFTGRVEVKDSLIIPSGAGSGKVLTSNANGQASWQTPAAGYTTKGIDSVLAAGSNANNDTISNLRMLGVGTPSPTANIDVLATEDFAINVVNNNNSTSDKKGVFSNTSGGLSGNNFGLYGGATGSSGINYGVYGQATGVAGTKYAIYGTTTGSNAWAGYFNQGNVYINDNLGIGVPNPARRLDVGGDMYVDSLFSDSLYSKLAQIDSLRIANSYSFPSADGNSGEVLVTNGLGKLDWQSISAGNTLDAAYDQGGAGAGRTITADSGDVRIAGTDGLVVTGTFASGSDVGVTGSGVRMFFNPKKAAFRAGSTFGTYWDPTSIGNYSIAMGQNPRAGGTTAISLGNGTNASGTSSIAIGSTATASGNQSMALGANVTANSLGAVSIGASSTAAANFASALGFGLWSASYAEVAVGMYNTIYTPGSTSSFNSADRIFVVGNGTSAGARSDAFIVSKNGNAELNGVLTLDSANNGSGYSFPGADGSNGQILTTNGSGKLTWGNSPKDTLSILQDTDKDTKIQLEKNPDEDIIRFDLGGAEVFRFQKGGQLNVFNGNRGTYLGGTAGAKITTGLNNTLIGYEAGSNLTNTGNNTFVGYQSGKVSSGSSNSTLGYLTGTSLSTGKHNVLIGASAGSGLKDGNDNVFIGTNAGRVNSSGGQNVYLGMGAGETNTGKGNVFLGYNAGNAASGDNQLYINNTSGSPLIYGDFAKDSLLLNGKVRIKDTLFYPLGASDGLILTSDASGRATWQTAPVSDTSLVVANSARTSWLYPDVDTFRFVSNSEEVMTIKNGRVGINMSSPSARLCLWDTVVTNQNAAFNVNTYSNSVNEAYGIKSYLSGNATIKYGVYSEVSGVSPFYYAAFNKATGAGTSSQYNGTFTEATGNGTSSTYYGLRTRVSGTGTNANYFALHAQAPTTGNSWAGYFQQGDVFIQDTLQLKLGATQAGQILTSIDNQGNAMWVLDTLVCPSGYSKANQNFCIETNQRTAATWFAAAEDCGDEDAELATYVEWYVAAQALTLTNETDDDEWVSNISQNNMMVVGNGNITTRAFKDPTLTSTYRCVIRK